MKRKSEIWALILLFHMTFLNGQEGLVGYWSFDSLAENQFFDLSGQGNHGFIFGANQVKGVKGNALSFDGQDDYAMIGEEDNPPQFLQDLGEGTISLWFRVDHIPRLHGIAPLFYYGGLAQCDFFDAANSGLILEVGHSPIHFESERLYFTMWKNGCTYPSFCFDSNDPIKEEQWYHLAVVVGSDFNTGYLNGYEIDNRRYNFGDASESQFFEDALRHEVLWLGKGHWDRTVQHLRGVIDELSIYNRVLSVEEIENLYLENAGTVGISADQIEKENSAHIFPNPVYSDLRYDIRLSGLEITGYSIMDLNGKILRSVNTRDKTGMIIVEGLSPGLYNLGFRAGDQVHVQKLLIGE
jgi:hypothetical protein